MNNKKKEKIGYVMLDFLDRDKQKVKNYFKDFIDEKYYFYAKVNGKNKGGLVLDEMHLTLFYGLDDKKFNEKVLDEIKINDIKLGKLELFYIKEFQCNALVLKINDKKQELKAIHNILGEFDVLREKNNKFKFNPHITIAYVKKGFEVKNKNRFLNEKIKVKSVNYKIKS